MQLAQSGIIPYMFVFMGLTMLLIAVYIKLFVRIIPPSTYYRHYRKGVIFREGDTGGMIVRIPFIDRLEIGNRDLDSHDERLSPLERAIRKQTTVMGDIAEVWTAWTTTEGARSFFAPETRISLRIGGVYEMYFDPAAPRGSKGGEGMRILSYLPMEMLSFEWNAPPSFPTLRREKTWVVVQFESLNNRTTRVTLTHCGWGKSREWDDLYTYFQGAWDIVMDRMTRRFVEGPIDWNQQDY